MAASDSFDVMPAQAAWQQRDAKRVKGIEPSPKAWEAFILPLNYTRGGCETP